MLPPSPSLSALIFIPRPTIRDQPSVIRRTVWCQDLPKDLSVFVSFLSLHKTHSSKYWFLKVWKFLLQNIAAPFWRLSNLKLNFHVNIEPMQTVFNLLFSRKPASRTPYHQVHMFEICISQDFFIVNPKPKMSKQYHHLRAFCANSLAYLCLVFKVSVSEWVPKINQTWNLSNLLHQ